MMMGATKKRIMMGESGGAEAAMSSSSSKSSLLSFQTSPTILFYAMGFFSCMIVMELTLEGANNSFPDLVALPYAVTLFQFSFCFILPCVISQGKSLNNFPKKFPNDYIPYISLSIVVFGSTFLASLSVRYVSYPTKVIFKSTKLIPTMIVATTLKQNKIQYKIIDYVAAILLCAGAAGYGWGSSGSGGSSASNNTTTTTTISYTGISCLLVSIFCDAFTPNIQQRLMAGSSSSSSSTTSSITQLPTTATTTATTTTTSSITDMTKKSLTSSSSTIIMTTTNCFKNVVSSLFLPTSINNNKGGTTGLSPQELMTNANGVGCIGLVLYMLITGSLYESLMTAIKYPFLLIQLLIIGLSLSTAVLCYTKLIQQSGSVIAVAVATLRKVVTVVLSYVVYPKPISSLHIISGLFVLGGILLSNHSKQQQQQKQRSSSSTLSSSTSTR